MTMPNDLQEVLSAYGVAEAARRTGIAPATLSRWINGKQNPSETSIRQLRLILDVPDDVSDGQPVATITTTIRIGARSITSTASIPIADLRGILDDTEKI